MLALKNLIMSAETLRGVDRLEGRAGGNRSSSWLGIAALIAAAVAVVTKPWDKQGDEDERVVERLAEGDETIALDKVRPIPYPDCDPEGLAAAARDEALACCANFHMKWDRQPEHARPQSITDFFPECGDVPTDKVCADDAPKLNALVRWCKRVNSKI